MVALETTAAAEETAAKPCSWHEVASAYVRLVLPNICQELTLRDGAKPKSTFSVGAIRAICSSACFSADLTADSACASTIKRRLSACKAP